MPKGNDRGKNTVLYPRDKVYPQDKLSTASGQVQRAVHKLKGSNGPSPVTKVEQANYKAGTGKARMSDTPSGKIDKIQKEMDKAMNKGYNKAKKAPLW